MNKGYFLKAFCIIGLLTFFSHIITARIYEKKILEAIDMVEPNLQPEYTIGSAEGYVIVCGKNGNVFQLISETGGGVQWGGGE